MFISEMVRAFGNSKSPAAVFLGYIECLAVTGVPQNHLISILQQTPSAAFEGKES